MKEELIASVSVRLLIRDGESYEDARDRLFELLYDGLCTSAEHVCDFIVENVESVR